MDQSYWNGVITSPTACFSYIILTFCLGLVLMELLRTGRMSGSRKRAPRMIAERLNALRRGTGSHRIDHR